MGIRGKGLDPGAGLAGMISSLEKKADTLAKLGTGELPKDASRGDVRGAMELLDSQINLVSNLAASNDPKTAAAAQKALEALFDDRLKLEDPALAKYFHHLRAKYQPAADGKPQGHLSDNELKTVLMLTGDKLSSAEKFALRMMEPFLTVEQRENTYVPALKTSMAKELDRGSWWSPQRWQVMGSAVAGPVGSMALSGILTIAGVVTPTAGMATMFMMSSAGQEVGLHLKRGAMGALADFGVNRLDDTAASSPLEKLVDHARSPRLFEGAADPKKTAAEEAAFATEMIGLAKETGQTVPPELEKYVTTLTALSTSTEPSAAIKAKGETARSGVVNAVWSEKVTVPGTEAQQPGPTMDAYTSLMPRIMQAHYETMLQVENPSAARIIKSMSKAYDVEGRNAVVDGGKKPEQAHLTKAEIQTLKAAVGPEASLAEYAVLRQMERAGLVKLEEVFGDDFRKSMPSDERAAIDGMTLADRDKGETLRWFGRWLPIAAKVAAGVVPALLVLTGVGIPAAIAVAVVARMGGQMAGTMLQAKGDAERVLAGVDATQRSVSDEYAIALQNLAGGGALKAKNAAELASSLKDQASVVETLAKSVDDYMSSADGLANVGDYMNTKGFVYDQLTAYAADLRTIAGEPGATLEGMKSKAFDAQVKLLDIRTLNNVALDQFHQATFEETPSAMARMFGGMAALMSGMGEVVGGVKPGEPLPENRALQGAAADVLAGFKDMKRSQRKALENNEVYLAAKGIFDKPLEHIDLKQMQGMLARKDQIRAKMETDWKDLGLISDDRAKDVAQDSMAFMWTQLLPLFGASTMDEQKKSVPKLNIDSVTRKDPAEKDQLPTLTAKGSVEGGGKFELTMSSYGVPQLESLTLDLGADKLSKVASSIVSHAQAMKSGAAAPALVDAVWTNKARKDDEPYEFSVGKSKVSVTPEGFPLYQTLALG